MDYRKTLCWFDLVFINKFDSIQIINISHYTNVNTPSYVICTSYSNNISAHLWKLFWNKTEFVFRSRKVPFEIGSLLPIATVLCLFKWLKKNLSVQELCRYLLWIEFLFYMLMLIDNRTSFLTEKRYFDLYLILLWPPRHLYTSKNLRAK